MKNTKYPPTCVTLTIEWQVALILTVVRTRTVGLLFYLGLHQPSSISINLHIGPSGASSHKLKIINPHYLQHPHPLLLTTFFRSIPLACGDVTSALNYACATGGRISEAQVPPYTCGFMAIAISVLVFLYKKNQKKIK